MSEEYYSRTLEVRCEQLEEKISKMFTILSWISITVVQSGTQFKEHECYSIFLKFHPEKICQDIKFDYEKNRLFKIYKTKLNDKLQWIVEYKDNVITESFDSEVPVKYCISFIIKKHNLDILPIIWAKEMDVGQLEMEF